MDKIENELLGLKKDFRPFFHTRVLAKIQNDDLPVWIPNLMQMLAGFCLFILGVFSVVYFQDGQLDYDSILGLSSVDYDQIDSFIYSY